MIRYSANHPKEIVDKISMLLLYQDFRVRVAEGSKTAARQEVKTFFDHVQPFSEFVKNKTKEEWAEDCKTFYHSQQENQGA